MRPAIGAALIRCGECGGYEYGGAPGCRRCAALVDDLVEEKWRRWRADRAGEPEHELARRVADEPDRHDWRVVDAALDRLGCTECDDRLGRGPATCAACTLAHGYRYAAVETDRPGVPPGNEHAVRVNISVVRRPAATSPQELLIRRLLLPALLIGLLPTTAQAQRLSAAAKADPSPERVTALVDAWLTAAGVPLPAP
ncbi:hypothetical protein [Nocardia farcinica]|uniref:hypothetical protein n=1 Tax=Nocardia farcinica TaxID=37329 RepID=UPI00189555A8|nr:hypothetical protein [Nocardia farcinica]MBF6231177.1 hypothetical protein [Nocardia farcinica]